MIKYFCDVCGAETDAGGNAPCSPASELCGLEDVCPRCEGLVRGLDASGLVLAELRRLARNPPVPEPIPDFVPVPAGRGAAEKREILAAVNTFRQERGPGAVPLLSKLAGVEESVLRDMIECHKVPLATWRKVGKALGVEGGG